MRQPGRQFEVQRVRILLGHLEALREAQRVLDEEYPLFISEVLHNLQRKLKTQTSLRGWKFFNEDAKLPKWMSLAAPDWRVLKSRSDFKAYIQIEIAFYDASNPSDPDDPGPWVGLWTPEQWGAEESFTQAFLAVLPPAVKSWSQEDRYPCWTPVDYQDYAAGGSFDVAAFERGVISAVLKVAALRPKIDRILRTL